MAKGSSLRFCVWCAEQLFPISPALSGEASASVTADPVRGWVAREERCLGNTKTSGVAMVTRAAFDLHHFVGLVALSSPYSATGALPKPAGRCSP